MVETLHPKDIISWDGLMEAVGKLPDAAQQQIFQLLVTLTDDILLSRNISSGMHHTHERRAAKYIGQLAALFRASFGDTRGNFASDVLCRSFGVETTIRITNQEHWESAEGLQSPAIKTRTMLEHRLKEIDARMASQSAVAFSVSGMIDSLRRRFFK